MSPSSRTRLLLRFWSGVVGSLTVGLLVFRLAVFDPGLPAFQCITVGTLSAAILALVRASFLGQALAVSLILGLTRLGLIATEGWAAALQAALAGLLLGAGLVVVAIIFDLLAARGLRVGKFLVMGPLVGGLFLAVTPIAEFSSMSGVDAMSSLVFHFFLGLIIGDGVGLGVEIVELAVEPAGAGEAEVSTLDPGSEGGARDGMRS